MISFLSNPISKESQSWKVTHTYNFIVSSRRVHVINHYAAVCFEVHFILLPQTAQTYAAVCVIPTSQGFCKDVVILKKHL